MLRLVTSSVPSATAPTRVALWRLEPELASYIERRLRARWPALVVLHLPATSPPGFQAQDIGICGAEPTPPPRVPTLWLGEVDRSRAMVQIGECLWKSGLPLTGRQLLRCVEELQRSACRARIDPTPADASRERTGHT
jgi:hypothetical protein